MTDRDDLALARWLAEGPDHGSRAHLDDVLRLARQTRQRRRWEVRARWLANPSLGPGRASVQVAFVVVVVLALLLALLLSLAVAGARRHPLLPYGPAANGLIAYAADGSIYLADPAGGSPRPIGGVAAATTPVFSPDGTRLVFWSQLPGDGGLALYAARADGSGLRQVSGDLHVRANAGYWPGWSPDSSRVVFASDDAGVQRLYVVPVDGSGPPAAITGRDASRWAPVWSPDGQWIAFGRQSRGAAPMDAVSVIHPDGSDERTLHAQPVLPDEGSFAESLEWSPDSRQIAYMRGHDATADAPDTVADYSAYLEALRLDGVERQLYAEPSGWLHLPAWSPDGSHIVFVTGESSLFVHVVDVFGGDHRIVTNCEAPLDDLRRWSPDGRWVLVACPGSPELVPIDGSAHKAFPLPSNATSVDWQRIAP